MGCLFLSLASKAQTKDGFEITGHLDGMEDGITVKLFNRFKDWHLPTWMDSCKVLNGEFHLKGGYIPEEPRLYEISFFRGAKERYDVHENGSIGLYISNGDKIKIQGSGNDIRNAKVEGSNSHDAAVWANTLIKYADNCSRQVIRRLRKIKDSIGYDQRLVGEQVVKWQNMDKYLDSATKNATAVDQLGIPVIILALHDHFGGYHGYFQKNAYDKLPSAIQNSYDGKRAKNLAALSIGQPFPEFVLPEISGNRIALKDFLHKGKITLVHFWETNSVDREIYQNELKVMYSKFHEKGLNIIGVSADTVREDWEFMIHQKKYPWANVLAEPKGWATGSLINDVYCEGGHSIPNTTNILLDDKGKILAWDVEGVLLQYYLEKYLNQ